MYFKLVLIVASFAIGASAADDTGNRIRTYLREYCSIAGGVDTVDGVRNAANKFMTCVTSLIPYRTLNTEIEQAKPNGAVNGIFKKYCEKSPQVKTCIHNLVPGITPCIPANTKEHLPGIVSNAEQLIDFVCSEDGKKIALFVAGSGPECFMEKLEVIKQCVDDFKSSVITVETKDLTFKEQCSQFNIVSQCVVKALKTCASPTPGDMAESLFGHVLNGSPCVSISY